MLQNTIRIKVYVCCLFYYHIVSSGCCSLRGIWVISRWLLTFLILTWWILWQRWEILEVGLIISYNELCHFRTLVCSSFWSTNIWSSSPLTTILFLQFISLIVCRSQCAILWLVSGVGAWIILLSIVDIIVNIWFIAPIWNSWYCFVDFILSFIEILFNLLLHLNEVLKYISFHWSCRFLILI
jgi:hypothetical protein